MVYFQTKLRNWIKPNFLNYEYLSENPNAISLLEENFSKINWYNLSQNKNAIHILEKNLNKIDWVYLSLNPNSI